jgi:hypothetical protein
MKGAQLSFDQPNVRFVPFCVAKVPKRRAGRHYRSGARQSTPSISIDSWRRVQHQRPTRVDVRRPEEYAVLESLGKEAEAGAIPEHNFDEVGLPTPVHEEMAREGILRQHALHQHREPIDAFAHVDIAEGQVHLHAPEEAAS